jgi:two-component system, OmpR family, manganese sensing sensor histidine kinase
VFKALRYRLLLSYLLVFASILGVFAIAVRIIFTRSLTHQLTTELIAIGQGAAAIAEFENGKFRVGEDFSEPELIAQGQALQWFDPQGRLMAQQGKAFPSLPFSIQGTVQIQEKNPRIQSVTLPVLGNDDRRLMGYVRASQSLAEADENLKKLDLGLGIGILMALILSGAGGIWLTRQAMQPIEESFQRLKQFTADASHELRSPLMAIKTNVSVALKYPEGIRSTDAEKFEAISSATTQMTRLSEDLLLLAQTDESPKPKGEPVNLTTILDQLIQLNEPQAKTKQIHLKSNLAEALFLMGDESQLTRLFTNLLVNALRYTPTEGTVEVQARRTGQTLCAQVRDTGIGIAPENLERIFERFWQADSSRSYGEEGAGLGLAIAQAIAQRHGGLITVTSRVGIGSCLTVSLPSLHSLS